MTSFLQFVENKKTVSPDDRVVRSAVTSFRESFPSKDCDDITIPALQNWIAHMMIAGLKPASRRKYLSILRALYKEWKGDTESAAIFDEVRKLAAQDIEEGVDRANANCDMIRRLLNITPTSSDYEIITIFLYLLFDPGIGLPELIRLKFGDDTPAILQLDEIIDSMRASKRKRYVFGLEQGKKREGRIIGDLLHQMYGVISAYGLELGQEISRDTITSIWIAAAFRIGIQPEEIRAIVRSIPKEYSFLQYILPAELETADRLRLMQKVADSIHDAASRWFVMKMRPGNTPDDIKTAISEADGKMLDDMTFYYPTQQLVIADKKGKRKKIEKPYLPSILFFKMRKDKVAPLFRNIGELAWCYRWSNTPDSPYCAISLREMKAFQKHIGSFTPDVRMEIVTLDTPLVVNQQVRIDGYGALDNQLGVIRSIHNSNGTRTYTLALSGKEFATWTVKDIEEIYLQPIS